MNTDRDEQWKMYSLLWDSIPFLFNRWTQNFKIFISFNAVLLPAVTILLGYFLKENIEEMRLFVFLLSIIAIYLLWLGYGIIKRIAIDFDLRFSQLRRLEKKLELNPVSPCTEGYKFFHNVESIFFNETDKESNFNMIQKNYPSKGIRAQIAYRNSVISFTIYYGLVAIYSIYPMVCKIGIYLCQCN